MSALSPGDALLAYRLRQQSLLAEFGLAALRSAHDGFDALLQRAAELCADGVRARFAKVLEFDPAENRFLVRAGVGWAPGVVGAATVGADLESPAGYALRTGASVISNHLTDESRFRTPRLLAEHGVKRAINVIVRSSEKAEPYGVLEADSSSAGQFDEADLAFMQGFANLLGVAIERRKADAARIESEEQAALVLEAARDYAILTTDLDGRITSWSAGAEALFGWPAAEVLGQDASVLFTPQDRAAGAPQRELQAARRTGCGNDERWHVRRDGSLFFANGSVRPLHDAAGKLRGFVKIAKDDTARRQAEVALTESEKRLKVQNALLSGVLGSTDDLVFAKDADGRYLLMNEAGARLHGRPAEEFLGRTDAELFPADLAAELRANDRDVLARGETLRFEEGTTIDGRPVTYQSTKAPLRDRDGRVIGIVGVAVDISDRKRAELLMRERVEQHEVLTREVSHRVKNSLQIVAALLGMQARGAADPQVRRAIADAEARVGAIAQVHDQLWRRGEAASVDLVAFLEDLCAKLRETAPQGVALRFETTVAEPVVTATDRAIPTGLLVNELVTNAFKYAYPTPADADPDGAGAAREVRVRLGRTERGPVRIEVADGGQGLPPGFDLGRPKGGSLGMRLIAGFVRQLGATLTHGSNETGRGARFALTLPTDPD